MENSHDIVLMIVIGVIILIQAYVFFSNYRKIQDYKNTIENTKDFEIIEVNVPEEWIEKIEVSEILVDPAAFQESVEVYSFENSSTQSEENIIHYDDVLERIEYSENLAIAQDEEGDYSDDRDDVEQYDDDQDYDGPFKSFRNKLKKFLE